MGWHELRNGDLLQAAERDGFDVLITSDKNIRHQNRLGGLGIAVLEPGTKQWPTQPAVFEDCLRPEAMPGPSSVWPGSKPVIQTDPLPAGAAPCCPERRVHRWTQISNQGQETQ